MSERFSQAEIDAIRERVKISEIVGQFVTWDRKKSAPRRGDMWACCPFHGEKSPSFHADDRRGIYHCFGCGAHGDVFRFLMEMQRLTFPEAIERLGGQADNLIDPAERARIDAAARAKREKADRDRARAEEDTRAAARSIWKETRPIGGTLAERYLRSRGIDYELAFPSLRFHPALRYWDRAAGRELGHFPALVAGLQSPAGEFLAVWRIYLDAQGHKRTDVPDAKLGLGAYTEAGGGVRLGEPEGVVNVCEGIETGLAVYGLTRRPTIAALSTSGLVNLRPPASVTGWLIWPDGDVDRIRNVRGRERKVESPGMRAAGEFKARAEAAGFPASIQPTPKNGRDYLDAYSHFRKRIAANA